MRIELVREHDPAERWSTLRPDVERCLRHAPADLGKGALLARILHGEALLFTAWDLEPETRFSYRGFVLLEFDSRGTGVNVVAMAIRPGHPGAFAATIARVAELAYAYGFARVEAWSRRRGMTRHLVRNGWEALETNEAGFRRFVLTGEERLHGNPVAGADRAGDEPTDDVGGPGGRARYRPRSVPPPAPSRARDVPALSMRFGV